MTSIKPQPLNDNLLVGENRDVNYVRRKVWLPVLVVLILMVLFPPWLYIDENTSYQKSAGYHFLVSPPPVKQYEEMFGFQNDMPTQSVRVVLNLARLITQILTLAFFAAGLVLQLQGDWSSGIFLAIGIIGVMLLILLMWLRF